MKLVHATWEPSGSGPFPTIFAMHGWGSNAMDLQGLAPYVADGRFLVMGCQVGYPQAYGFVIRMVLGQPINQSLSPAGVIGSWLIGRGLTGRVLNQGKEDLVRNQLSRIRKFFQPTNELHFLLFIPLPE